MGRYDDMTPDQLRERLVRTARLILKMDENDVILARTPELLKLFGELRRMLFAYEVRCAPGAEEDQARAPSDGSRDGDPDDATSHASEIVEEAIRRQQELQDELRRGFFPDDD